MAVLPRPASGHVRAAGEAIAIVDLDERPEPRTARAGDARVTAIMGAASLALVAAGLVALAQRPIERTAVTLITRDDAGATGGVVLTAAPPPAVAFSASPSSAPLLPALALPLGTTGARLSAIPDALLNDPPAARFRVRIEVRGLTGLASVDLPTVIVWSEGGYWYELSSGRLSVPQLIHLASALE